MLEPFQKCTVIRSRRRTLALQVTQEGHVLVRAPERAPLSMIERMVTDHTAWIARARERMAQKPKRVIRTFSPGSTLAYLGQEWPLSYTDSASAPVEFRDEFIVDSAKASSAKRLLEQWYKLQARFYFTNVAERVAREHDLHYTRLRLSSARTRWGSCSRGGSISLTWRLIFAPPAVIEYVICHELAHLLHHDHSPRFWAAVERLQPDFADHRRWLKLHGQSLHW